MRKNICSILTVALIATFLPTSVFSWGLPTQISAAGTNFNSSVATSLLGNAEVVWTNGSTIHLCILSSTYSAGTWSAPVAVSDVGINDSANVAIDALGNAVVVWVEVIAGDTVIRAATKNVGGAWSLPSTISTSNSSSAPAISMNGVGHVIAGWIDNEFNTIEVAHLTFGGAWSAPIVISNLSGTKTDLSIGIDSLGNGFAAWQEYEGGDIYASNSTGLIWSLPVALTTNGNNEAPVLSVSDTGEALVAWVNEELSEIRATWFKSGSWSFIPRVISSGINDVPAVAALLNDGFTSWLNKDSGEVLVSNYTSDEWSYPPQEVSTSTNNGSPSVSMDSTNTAIITWADNVDGSINAVEFPSGGAPGIVQQISNAGINYSPRVVSSGTQSVAAWQTSSGSDWLIFVNVN